MFNWTYYALLSKILGSQQQHQLSSTAFPSTVPTVAVEAAVNEVIQACILDFLIKSPVELDANSSQHLTFPSSTAGTTGSHALTNVLGAVLPTNALVAGLW